jgi:(p)ppGpp synthase/HD superfamily hydrolase
MSNLSSRFTEALIFATELHATQKRKSSGVPYVAHLLGTASLVLEYGGSEDEAIAALLHDGIEDQGGAETREKIYAKFGEKITKIVDECSEIYQKPKPSWLIRKEEYLKKIPTISDSARLVMVADKIYNLRSIIKDYRLKGDQVWSDFHGGRDGTLWYYQTLVDNFSQGKITPIIEELIRVKEELNSLVFLS